MVNFVAPEPIRPVDPGPTPTFSVTIAAFQAAATIAAAVQSALDQRPEPIEVVVCDDGSTDDTAGALAAFGDRVRLIRIDHAGESAAKNAAIRAARSEFVAILDADDLFLPGRLAAVGELASKRPDLDVITTDAYLELDAEYVGRCYHEEFRFATVNQRSAILRANFVFGHVVARRSRLLAAGGFDERIAYTADWECWIRMMLNGSTFGFVDEPLAVYRMHEAAMSASRERMYRGRVETLTKTARDSRLSESERDAVLGVLGHERARLELEQARVALMLGNSDARRRAWSVVRSPTHTWKARLRAVAAVLAPSLIASALHRRDRRSWIGVGDVRYRRRAPVRAD